MGLAGIASQRTGNINANVPTATVGSVASTQTAQRTVVVLVKVQYALATAATVGTLSGTQKRSSTKDVATLSNVHRAVSVPGQALRVHALQVTSATSLGTTYSNGTRLAFRFTVIPSRPGGACRPSTCSKRIKN